MLHKRRVMALTLNKLHEYIYFGYICVNLLKKFNIDSPITPFYNACCNNPDSKVHGAKMGLTWVLSAPDGPHVAPMNLAIREAMDKCRYEITHQSIEAWNPSNC